MIVDYIKELNNSSRKMRNIVASDLLSTLYSEVVNVGKNNGNRETTDKEALTVVKKFLDGVQFTLDHIKDDTTTERYLKAKNEGIILSGIIEKFQPKQLTTEELTDIIVSVVATLTDKSPKQMGYVMKVIKDTYDGQYNGSDASKIVKEVLSS